MHLTVLFKILNAKVLRVPSFIFTWHNTNTRANVKAADILIVNIYFLRNISGGWYGLFCSFWHALLQGMWSYVVALLNPPPMFRSYKNSKVCTLEQPWHKHVSWWYCVVCSKLHSKRPQSGLHVVFWQFNYGHPKQLEVVGSARTQQFWATLECPNLSLNTKICFFKCFPNNLDGFLWRFGNPSRVSPKK